MKKLLEKVDFWPIILAAVAVALCVLNYTPNTWLSGWDTLHPEFNFSLYFKRIFFSVWQEHQGLGAVATQAHASEIPRMLIYYPLSFILPQNFLRYSYFFLTLIAGCLGMFYFLRGTFFKNSKENIHNLASFSGGLFYLLNIGTLQQYYLPLEMFATHFAFLPWLFLFAFKILSEGKRKNYLILAILTFFNAPIAHTPTLFYAYFLGLIVFIFGYFILNRNSWKKCFAILGLTLAINSFWLLPHLYFVFTSGNIVQNSKISSMFSQTAFSTGQKFGDVKNTLFLKNYLFEWGKYDPNQGQFIRLLGEWKSHLGRLEVAVMQYMLALMVMVGLAWSVKEKKSLGYSVLGIFAVSFLLIANDVPVIRHFYEFLQNNIPLFKEALRFPYTKFSILLMFSQSAFFGVFWEKAAGRVIKDLSKFKEREICRNLGLIILAILVYFMLPSFKGNLFNKDMRVKFPDEYFSAMEFLNSQKNQRIALLPMPQIWGWIYHDWGYEGAGFEWFGLQNPLLDREFDRWNPCNEQFYWEASYALYSKNHQLFENVLEKYRVGWLVVDESVINPSSPKALFLGEIEDILNNEQRTINNGKGKFELVQIFGKIRIYKVNLETKVKDFVYLAGDLPVVNGYEWGNEDKAFEELGNYVSIDNSKLKTQNSKPQLKTQNLSELNAERYTLNAYYPFRSLFTGRKTDELKIEIEDLGDRIVFRAPIPEGLEDYVIELPKDYEGKELVEIDPITYETKYFIPSIDVIQGEDEKGEVGREVRVGSEEITVSFQKVKGLLSAEVSSAGRKLEGKEEMSFYLPNLSHKYAYLISAEAKNIEGKPLLFWIENLTNRKADIETYLLSADRLLTTEAEDSRRFAISRLIQPPMAEDGLGYTLHFDNISIGKQRAINELGRITVYQIPYRFLTRLKMVKGEADTGGVKLSDPKGVNVEHPNPAVYEITINQPTGEKTILVLSQSFHSGWKAYNVSAKLRRILPFLCGEEIKEHVRVNNWENGWILTADSLQLTADSNKPKAISGILLVFWPQWLEWAGFGLMFICLIVVAGFNLRQKSAD